MRLKYIILFFCTVSVSLITGQIQMAGYPLSYSHIGLIEDAGLPVVELTTPNIGNLLSTDLIQSRSDAIWRDAIAIPANVNVLEEGTWYDIAGVGRICKLIVKAPDALSLELNFDGFFLPDGAKLFVYNPDHTEFIGGFTSDNNKSFSSLSTHMIQGESCILEYFEPFEVNMSPVLHLMDVTFRYRDFLRLEDNGGSQQCEIDVSCIDNETWNGSVNSVVRIRSRIGNDFFWSTGVLMNNTNEDCKPYILTSLRSVINPYTIEDAEASDLHFFRYYFDYQRGECGEGKGLNKSISGSYRRADSNDNGGELGSDFLLLELSCVIPESYNAYWAGWNVSENPNANAGFTVHHPLGDVKKISVFNSSPVNADYGISNTHWKVTWSDIGTSGKGVTEVGSIGAPLFDSEGLVFGTLTAGGSSCDSSLPGASNNPDYFGKMSKHWMSNPNAIPMKLRSWLDPAATGNTLFEGSSNPCVVGVRENFSDSEIIAWPNPVKNEWHVKLPDTGIFYIGVHDMLGRLVLSDRDAQGVSILDFSELPNGVYAVSITSVSHGSFSSKVIVER